MKVRSFFLAFFLFFSLFFVAEDVKAACSDFGGNCSSCSGGNQTCNGTDDVTFESCTVSQSCDMPQTTDSCNCGGSNHNLVSCTGGSQCIGTLGDGCGYCASPICNNNGSQDNGESGTDCGGGGCGACPTAPPLPPPPAGCNYGACGGSGCSSNQRYISGGGCPSWFTGNGCYADSSCGGGGSYNCPNGTACDGTPVTGTPNQQICGTDYRTYTCTSSGWSRGGSCTCNTPPSCTITGPASLAPGASGTFNVSGNARDKITRLDIYYRNLASSTPENGPWVGPYRKANCNSNTCTMSQDLSFATGNYRVVCNVSTEASPPNNFCSGNVLPGYIDCGANSRIDVPVTTPSCSNTPVCGSCTAAANTCSTNNGTQSCNYTGPSPCNQVAFDQACTIDACVSPRTCVGGACLPTCASLGGVCLDSNNRNSSGNTCQGGTDQGATSDCSAPRPRCIAGCTLCGALGQTCCSPASSCDAGLECNANVCIVRPAWWQVKDADVISTGNVRSLIPSATYKFSENGTGGYPGIVSYVGSLTLGSGTLSSTNWKANSGYSGRRYDYAYATGQIPSDVFTDPKYAITSGTIQASDLKDSSKLHPDGYFWSYRNGDLTINGTANELTEKVMLVVNGNLTIGNNITVSDGQGFFGTVVKGNIDISSQVSHPNNVSLEGMFLSDGQFRTGIGNGRLYMRGSIAAWGGISLQRDLGGNSNTTTSAEFIEYAPDMILAFPRELMRSGIIWREIAP